MQPAADADALVEELAQRPDDVELLRVFADWLLQQGHPVGELVAVQLARLAGDTQELAKREDDLLVNAIRPYVERLFDRKYVTSLTWRRGLLDTILFDHHGGEENLADRLQRLAGDPATRLVRRIEISAVQFDGAGDLEPAIAELARLAPYLPRLRAIALSEGMNLGNPWIEGPIRVGDLAPLYAAYPRLEVLEVAGKEYQLGTLDLPALRRLAIEDMSPVDIDAVAMAELPALVELGLGFGRFRVDHIDGVFRKLLDRTLPMVASVAFAAEVPQVMQYLVRAVPGSALARKARVLAFRGAIDDDCVRTLVQWAPRLRVLERLELAARGLSPDARARLAATFGHRLVVR